MAEVCHHKKQSDRRPKGNLYTQRNKTLYKKGIYRSARTEWTPITEKSAHNYI